MSSIRFVEDIFSLPIDYLLWYMFYSKTYTRCPFQVIRLRLLVGIRTLHNPGTCLLRNSFLLLRVTAILVLVLLWDIQSGLHSRSLLQFPMPLFQVRKLLEIHSSPRCRIDPPKVGNISLKSVHFFGKKTYSDMISNEISSILAETGVKNAIQSTSFILISINTVLNFLRCITEEVFQSDDSLQLGDLRFAWPCIGPTPAFWKNSH
jgi:hypothetical protein